MYVCTHVQQYGLHTCITLVQPGSHVYNVVWFNMVPVHVASYFSPPCLMLVARCVIVIFSVTFVIITFTKTCQQFTQCLYSSRIQLFSEYFGHVLLAVTEDSHSVNSGPGW